MEIRARISAVMDTDLSTVFRPLIEDSKRARQAVTEQARGMGQGVATAAQQAAAREREVFKATHELQLTMIKQRMAANKDAYAQDAATKRQAMSLAQKSATDQLKIEADLYKQKEKLRAADQAAQAKFHNQAAIAAQRHQQRLAQQANAEQLRANRQAPESSTGGFSARSFASEGMRSFSSTVRAGVGVASQIARGAGVNFDLGSMLASGVNVERRAVDLMNASAVYNKEGHLTSRANKDELMAETRKAANANALSQESAMEGLASFNAKTGDLETGRKILSDMGKLARATGTEFSDMQGAAGEVAKSLGDMEDKGKKAEIIKDVMRTVAAQGKLGAVEISDMATYMGKIASGARGFQGDVGNNIKTLSAFAQLAAQGGGASSAAEAASSVAGLVNTLKTPKRKQAFAAEGIDIEDKKTGLLRSPEEILFEALSKTNGDTGRMKKMFANVIGSRSVEDLTQTFKASGGGAAGLVAAKERFNTFKMASMSNEEVDVAHRSAMETQAAKAQLFNNQMQEVVSAMATKMLPALDSAAPKLLELAGTAGNVVGALANMSTGELIAGALVGSIAKAGLDQALKSAMESSLGSKAGLAIGTIMVTAALATIVVEEMKKDEKMQRQKAVSFDEAVARMEKDTALFNTAQSNIDTTKRAYEQALDYEASLGPEKKDEPKEKKAQREAARRQREEAQAQYVEAQKRPEQLRLNLESSTEEVNSWRKTAGRVKEEQGKSVTDVGFTASTWWNKITGNSIGSGGGPNRDDVATAEAVFGKGKGGEDMAQRAQEGVERGMRALGKQTLRVEVVNVPPGGTDPSLRTGPEGRRGRIF